MSETVIAIVHPPGKDESHTNWNFRASEMAAAAKHLRGRPMFLDHDMTQVFGHVDRTVVGANSELITFMSVDKSVIPRIKSGEFTDTSLTLAGREHHSQERGIDVLNLLPIEVSLTNAPCREGSKILAYTDGGMLRVSKTALSEIHKHNNMSDTAVPIDETAKRVDELTRLQSAIEKLNMPVPAALEMLAKLGDLSTKTGGALDQTLNKVIQSVDAEQKRREEEVKKTQEIVSTQLADVFLQNGLSQEQVETELANAHKYAQDIPNLVRITAASRGVVTQQVAELQVENAQLKAQLAAAQEQIKTQEHTAQAAAVQPPTFDARAVIASRREHMASKTEAAPVPNELAKFASKKALYSEFARRQRMVPESDKQ